MFFIVDKSYSTTLFGSTLYSYWNIIFRTIQYFIQHNVGQTIDIAMQERWQVSALTLWSVFHGLGCGL